MFSSERLAEISSILAGILAGDFPQRGTRWAVLPFLAAQKALRRLCREGHGKKIFFFKIFKSNNSQESAIKKISNFPSLFRKRLSFCRENQVENYEIEVQSPLGVKVKVRCTLTFKKHLCFQKAPMSPKRSWSAKNHLARQKSSWPGKKHRARQKSPGLAKTTRPAKNHLARQKPPGPPKITCPAKKHPALRTFLHIIPERYTFIDGDISAW